MSSYIDFLSIPKSKEKMYERYINFPDGCFNMDFDDWLFENSTADFECYGRD